jgi:predicted alpha/beta-fold hydrolase
MEFGTMEAPTLRYEEVFSKFYALGKAGAMAFVLSTLRRPHVSFQAMALSVNLGGNATANATTSIAAALLSQASANGFHPTCGLASCRHILQGLTVANASAALTMATMVRAAD